MTLKCGKNLKNVHNWRAQSKNDPLIFWPFLKVSTCQNSTTSEHFQKWPKNQVIVLALSPPIDHYKFFFLFYHRNGAQAVHMRPWEPIGLKQICLGQRLKM